MLCTHQLLGLKRLSVSTGAVFTAKATPFKGAIHGNREIGAAKRFNSAGSTPRPAIATNTEIFLKTQTCGPDYAIRQEDLRALHTIVYRISLLAT